MTKGARTREQVVEQAAALFNQHGYRGASISDVMAATGLKKGGIYRHFASKEALAIAAFVHATEKMKARFVAALAGKTGAVERLQAIIAGAAADGEFDRPFSDLENQIKIAAVVPVGSVGKPAPAIGAWRCDWVAPACPSACGQAEGLSKVAVGSSGTGSFEPPTIGIALREPVPELSTATARRGTVHRLCRASPRRRDAVAAGTHPHPAIDKRKCFAGSTSLIFASRRVPHWA